MKTAKPVAKKTDGMRNSGFSLIELSIAIIISGLMFLALFELFSGYIKKKAGDDTAQNVQAAVSQISLFNIYQSRYPFPADPTLPVTDPKYGLEVDPAVVGLTVGNCYSTNGAPKITPAGTNGAGGVCMVGCANGVAGPTGGVAPAAPGGNACGDGTGAANNPVLIGAVPINSIRQTVGARGVTNQMAFDGWGSQLTYAVTSKLTNSATYKYNLGAISVVDEFYQPIGGFNNDAHFVVVSHGTDRSGAYTRNGQMTGICKYLVAGAGLDNVNCGNNAEFIEAIDNSTAKGVTHYDDYVYANKFGLASLWKTVPGSSDMQNQNTGSVLVGTANAPPVAGVTLYVQDPAGVAGNGVIQAQNNAKAATICDSAGANCFPIKAITGSGIIHCNNPNDLMTGVSLGAAICDKPKYSPAKHCQFCCGAVNPPPCNPPKPCIPGTYVNSMAADGTITCQ